MEAPLGARLPFALALRQLLNALLHRAASHSGCPLRLRSGFLALCALQFFSLRFVGNVLGVHSSLIPAYFSTSFFNP